jgi:hypothetical protein
MMLIILLSSQLNGQNNYPLPFVQEGSSMNNPKHSAAVSTGYYYVRSNDKIKAPWKAEPSILDTSSDKKNWRRILSGPNQRSKDYWHNNPFEGLRYFWNPKNLRDSCDNGIAGPIPIGFKFLFNGIEYDSFYISTNGAIILSNSRYFYDQLGNRELRNNNYGQPNCYNTMSMDWFERAKHNKDGLTDTMPDDFGWQKAVQYACDSDFVLNSKQEKNGWNINLPIISPAWGDCILSQWNSKTWRPEDNGKVYFYRDTINKKLIVYFVELQLNGNIQVPYDSIYISNPNALRAGDNNYLSANFQIVLDANDSSIVFNYEKFTGELKTNNVIYKSNEVFRFNTSCMVSGKARHINYNSKTAKLDSNYKGTLPWAGEYPQSTTVWSKLNTEKDIYYPDSMHAIKFKQWKNTIRVCDISFRVRPQKRNSPDFSKEVLTSKAKNFEILAGHEQIGQVQPVIIVQNLSNDIQGPDGINFQPQDLNFRVRCAVINQLTRRPLYNKYIKVDSLALANKSGEAAYEKVYFAKASFDGIDYTIDTANFEYYDVNGKMKNFDGIPPYGYGAIFFPPFEPNDLFDTHIGPMKVFAMLDPTDPRTGIGFGDRWAFDDTLSIPFNVIKHIERFDGWFKEFKEDGRDFHVIKDDDGNLTAIPNALRWVSKGARIVNGEDVSLNPLPPRDKYGCKNFEAYTYNSIKSPVIELNRPASVAIGEWGGDEIISHPIDLNVFKNPILTLSIQRTKKRDDWQRGWSDEMLIGCEHRVVANDWYNEIQKPDEIRVQFAKPSPNWKDGAGMTNIPEENWTYHPGNNGGKAITDMSAYTLFGGGGYMTGFSEKDKNLALEQPVYDVKLGRRVNGLRYDYYDDGIDFVFKKVMIPIPDYYANASNEGSKYFRFRIQVNAKNNQISATSIPDDDDDFYVDNISLREMEGDEDVDIECIGVNTNFKYSVAPASQAIAIPISNTIANNINLQAPSFWIKTHIFTKNDFGKMFFLDNVWIYRGDPNTSDYEEKLAEFRYLNELARDSARWQLFQNKSIYCRVKNLPLMRGNVTEQFTMPSWDARLSPPGDYVIVSIVYVPGGDLEPQNDTNYTTVNINFGPMMAYHPIKDLSDIRQADNNVEEQYGRKGKGLSIYGYKLGGVGTSWYPEPFEYGDDGGSSSGQIAMKFELFQEDTLFGYGAYFGSKNSAPDHITYRLYEGLNYPAVEVPGSVMFSKRGYDAISNFTHWDKFVFDSLKTPIVLKKGTYWVAVSQLGEDGLELGASRSYSAMRSTKAYYHKPQTADKNGSKGIFLNIDKRFRINKSTRKLVTWDENSTNQITKSNVQKPIHKYETTVQFENQNFFAYENGLGSGSWEKFTETVGNPAYGHLTHEGYPPKDNQTKTFSRGSWMPLLVPYFGNRSYNNRYYYQYCWGPVELTYFNGFIRNGAVDLIWETASEINNYGFYVERKIEDDVWKTHSGLIPGNGTSNIQHEYGFEDKEVLPNTTYHYRLRQVDNDGTQTCDDFSNIVTLTYTEKGEISILPNSPNPFSDKTAITFILPYNEKVSLDVMDLFGNVITTILDENLSAGKHIYYWNGKNNFGKKCSAGAYLVRLRAGKEVLTRKIMMNSGF